MSDSDVSPVYRLQGVVKAYAGQEVLRVSDLTIYRGKVLGIVGPNGAGKSTLLRLLGFLEPPDRGQLAFAPLGGGLTPLNGREVPLDWRRQVTLVFQRSVLLNRSVAANVAYGLQLRRERDTGERVREALAQVRLADLARASARTLSGGEAQRVALARALAVRPRVLLLDEPTANLDPYNIGLIEGIIRQLSDQHDTTIVLVTHNVFQARRLANRVAFMLQGRIVEVAPVEQFFAAPRDPRTAAFVRGDVVC